MRVKLFDNNEMLPRIAVPRRQKAVCVRVSRVVGAAAIVGTVLVGASARTPRQGESLQEQSQEREPEQRLMLLSGNSMDLSQNWVQREQEPLPPSPRLAPFAPRVTFLEFTALENPRTHSVLRMATTTNPFLGQDEVTLDTQMHGVVGAGSSLVDYLFYFFFSPPRDCLDDSSEAYEKAQKEAGGQGQTTPDLSVHMECKHAPVLTDFYSWELSPGVVFQLTSGVKRAAGTHPKFYLPPMEKMEANGLTFYVFEAQGQTRLDLRAVNHFNLPDDLQGAQPDFFWAVGAQSPFPFLKDPLRKNVPVIQVAYAGIGLAPNKRDNFIKLLRHVHSP